MKKLSSSKVKRWQQCSESWISKEIETSSHFANPFTVRNFRTNNIIDGESILWKIISSPRFFRVSPRSEEFFLIPPASFSADSGKHRGVDLSSHREDVKWRCSNFEQRVVTNGHSRYIGKNGLATLLLDEVLNASNKARGPIRFSTRTFTIALADVVSSSIRIDYLRLETLLIDLG